MCEDMCTRLTVVVYRVVAMDEHPNAITIKKGYAAFLMGDTELLRQLMADDIVWHSLGNNILTGSYHGKAEVIGLFGKIIMETEGTLNLEVDDVIASDTRAVILTKVTAERNGKKLDSDTVNIYLMNPQGKVVEAFGPYSDDTATIDDFWS